MAILGPVSVYFIQTVQQVEHSQRMSTLVSLRHKNKDESLLCSKTAGIDSELLLFWDSNKLY